MAKKKNDKVTSRPGMFGTMNHYDSKGKKIGESRPGMFGTTNHYDAKGRKTGSSAPGIFASQVHYDNKGHKTGSSYNGLFDTDHYDAKGNPVGHTHNSGFGTKQSNFDSGSNYNMVTRDREKSAFAEDMEELGCGTFIGGAIIIAIIIMLIF